MKLKPGEDMQLRSFVARLVYRIRCEAVFEEQYEEQWRLLFAEDERSALAAARLLGKAEEEVFTDQQERSIEWQLLAVKDLQEVDLAHGALLASVVKEVEPLAAPVWAA